MQLRKQVLCFIPFYIYTRTGMQILNVPANSGFFFSIIGTTLVWLELRTFSMPELSFRGTLLSG